MGSSSLAKLVVSFFVKKPRYSLYAESLSSISEDTSKTVHLAANPPPRRARSLQHAQPHSMPLFVDELEPEALHLLNDVVEHIREPQVKERGRCAGLSRVRRSRCSFMEFMTLVDEAGAVHSLGFHSVRRMPRDLQRQAHSKWPSKVTLQRQRALERRDKAFD